MCVVGSSCSYCNVPHLYLVHISSCAVCSHIDQKVGGFIMEAYSYVVHCSVSF